MKKLFSMLFFLGLNTVSVHAYAEDLMDVYHDALLNDPTFQTARANQLATHQDLPISLAGILPNLNLVGNSYGQKQTAVFRGISPTKNYNQRGYTLTLTQPLFNFANWLSVVQANSTVKQANAVYASASLNLMLRVASAYFNVLQSEDNLRFIQALKASTARQLEQAKQRYDVGLEAITTVYNAQASYDSSVAQEISAKNTIQNNLEILRQITGRYYDCLAGLKGPTPLLKPDPMNADCWVSAGINHNYDLLAAKYAADAARANIKVNMAGHLPTLNAVGFVQQNDGFTPVVGGYKIHINSAGVQVNVPIFTGGLVVAQTHQAEYNYQAATSGVESTYRNTVSQIRQNFNNVMSGISKIQADLQAVKSNAASLASTEESYRVGTRTIVDVLLAQQTLLQAQEAYAADQYSYLINSLTLKQYAGTLVENDLRVINDWLQENPEGFSGIVQDKYVDQVLGDVNQDVDNPPKLYKNGRKPPKNPVVPQT